MAFKIIVTDKAENDLIKTAQFIDEKWSKQDAGNFIDKIDEVIGILQEFPLIGSIFNKGKNIRIFVVLPQVRLYYRIKNSRIILLTFFDTRQHPKKLKL